MAKRLSNRDMLTALYNKFCTDRKSLMDTGKQIVVAGEQYIIPDNWQSEPPPGFTYDDALPPTGYIWVYNPQTGERKSIKACEGGLS